MKKSARDWVATFEPIERRKLSGGDRAQQAVTIRPDVEHDGAVVDYRDVDVGR